MTVTVTQQSHAPFRLLSLKDQDLARLFEHLPDKFEETGLGQARILRAVGQIVESLGLADFDLETVGEHEYVIRGRLAKARRRSGLFKRLSLSFTKPKAADAEVVELRCTQEMIQQFDDQGKRRRRSLDGTPDPLSPSQVLRSLGRYLDERDALLQRVERKGETVTLEYESALGDEESETKLIPHLQGASERRFTPGTKKLE